jgi:hypothetical protein
MANNLSKQTANLPPLYPSSSYNYNVETLQNALMSAGYLNYNDFATGPGYYGQKTINAVKAWQGANGYSQTGNFDSSAIASLKSAYPDPAPVVTPPPAPVVTTPVVNNPVVNNPVVNNPVVNNPAPVVNNTNTSSNNNYQAPVNNPVVQQPAVVTPVAPAVTWPTTNLVASQTFNQDVVTLQKALVAGGFMSAADAAAGSGYYGPKTTAAVTALQNSLAKAGLMPQPTSTGIGVYGPQTSLAAIKTPTITSTGVASSPASNPTTLPAGLRLSLTTPGGVQVYTANDGGTYNSTGQKMVPSTTNPAEYVVSTGANNVSNMSGTKGKYVVRSTDDGKGNVTTTYSDGTTVTVDSTGKIVTTKKVDPVTGAVTTTDGSGNTTTTTTSPISATKVKGDNPLGQGEYYIYSNGTSVESFPGDAPVGKVGADGKTITFAPSLNGVTDPAALNSGITQLTQQQITNIATQAFAPGSPEYEAARKKAMDEVSLSMYDILEQQFSAKTEQEQTVANYNWGKLKDYVQKNLGITLSGNASQSIDQIKQLQNQFNTQNIQGSGLQNETVDSYLKKIRMSDESARAEAMSKKEGYEKDYYTTSASSAQIADLVRLNPQKARDWGLVPSDELRNALTPQALKQKFPNMTDDEINSTILGILDKTDGTGNYRSTIYQKLYSGNNPGVNVGSYTTTTTPDGRMVTSPVTPGDIGYFDIETC